MRNLWSRYWIWVVVAAALWMFSGCEMYTDGFQTVSIDGGTLPDTKSGFDADMRNIADLKQAPDLQVTPDLLGVDLQNAQDTLPVLDMLTMSDTETVLDQKPPIDTKLGVDTKPQLDIKPAIPCDSPGKTGMDSTTIFIPRTEYCFKLCPAASEPIDPIEYSWTCSFTDSDRKVTVNGKAVSCQGLPPRVSSGSALPAVVDGAWTFIISAGSFDDTILWGGTLHTCSGH